MQLQPQGTQLTENVQYYPHYPYCPYNPGPVDGKRMASWTEMRCTSVRTLYGLRNCQNQAVINCKSTQEKVERVGANLSHNVEQWIVYIHQSAKSQN